MKKKQIIQLTIRQEADGSIKAPLRVDFTFPPDVQRTALFSMFKAAMSVADLWGLDNKFREYCRAVASMKEAE